jgi:hypothetical protein
MFKSKRIKSKLQHKENLNNKDSNKKLEFDKYKQFDDYNINSIHFKPNKYNKLKETIYNIHNIPYDYNIFSLSDNINKYLNKKTRRTKENNSEKLDLTIIKGTKLISQLNSETEIILNDEFYFKLEDIYYNNDIIKNNDKNYNTNIQD